MKHFSNIFIALLMFFAPPLLSAQKAIEIKIIDKRYVPPAITLKIPQEFKDKGARFVVRAGDVIKICNADKLFAKPTSLSKENKFQGIEGPGGLRPGSCITIKAQNPGNKPISFWLHDNIHGSARLFLVVLPANWPDEGEENTPQLSGACKLEGSWKQDTPGVGSTVWGIKSNGIADEIGIGFAKGKAYLSGNVLHIDWQTKTGYSGYYEWTLDDNCSNGKGKLVFKTGRTDSLSSTVKKN